jgi:hypothetical protein
MLLELFLALALAMASATAGGSNNTGYEGQPGNQSHNNSSNPGLVGYEGTPGNQGKIPGR